MLVHGDRDATAAPRQVLRSITAALNTVEHCEPGPRRHDLLTSAFLETAGLLQGIADAEMQGRGFDELSPAQDAAMALTLMLARKLTASAWSGFAAIGSGVTPELMELAIQQLPERVTIFTPRAFALDAVYPEAYLKAAAEHPWPAPPLVIGLRSAGAALGALVAAAPGARTVVTLRATGPASQRELHASSQIRALLTAHQGPFAIVDEGSAAAGGSFEATADLLASLGVSSDRIVFLPSQLGGLGPAVDLRHRTRWASAARAVATFEDLVGETPLADWFSDLTGQVARVDNLSGGAWRAAGRFAETPPAYPARERLKFRLHSASGQWLARFAGLGVIGEAKLDRAIALHRAGFTPEPLALRRGFLLERWEETGAPGPLPRQRFVEQLGAYLGFRAMAFPAEDHEGASREVLAEMAQANIREALGPDTARGLLRVLPRLVSAPAGQRVHVDGRLHVWEWLRTPDDLILKADALDHSASHDLVGAQEIDWDIAGAKLEFDLTAHELARVRDAVRDATGERPHPAALLFFEICYAAFQAGCWRTALAYAPAAEATRLATQAARYEERLGLLAQAAESSE